MMPDRERSRAAGAERTRGACAGRNRGETLDEAIDRVAASLTAVPADPAFGTRLQLRMQQPPRLGFNVLAGAVATVALAVLVAVLWRGSSVSVTQHDLIAGAVSRIAPSVAISASAIESPDGDNVGPLTTRVRSAPAYPISDVSATMIAALPNPHLLAVEMLSVEPLAVPVVEVEALELRDLALAPIDALEEYE